MRHEDIAHLLQDGVVIQDPRPGLGAAADHLESVGLIGVERAQFVRCADPADGDFAWSNRTCAGEIVLPADYDATGGEFRCPACARLVFPDTDAKRPHRQMRVRVKHEGVMAYLRSLVFEAIGDAEEVAGGVLRAPVGVTGVYVCLVDACAEARFLSRDWARTQPTCYVLVDPRLAGRFLQEEWICRVTLADVVAGDVDFATAVVEAAGAGPPAVLQNASVPVCALSVLPIADGPRLAAPADRCFVVQVTGDRVFIEGEPVMAAQSDTRYLVFRVFWERFLEDLREGRAPDQFRLMDLAAILKELGKRAGRQFADEMTVRRTINRLQTDFMTVLRRKRGLPIQREDIIETCRWAGQGQREYGYRLNPFTVAVRARAGDSPR